MKNYFASFLLLLSTAGAFSSCREQSKLPAPQLSGSLPLITPVVTSDPEKNHFDFLRTQASDNLLATSSRITNRTRPVFEFSFDLDNTRDKKVKTVEVYKSFQRSGVLGTRVLQGSYSSFPVTISINSQDALQGLQRVFEQPSALPYVLNVKGANPTTDNNGVQNSIDNIVFTFEYILEDDTRIILTPTTRRTAFIGGSNGLPTTVTTVVSVLAATTQINAPFAVFAPIRN